MRESGPIFTENVPEAVAPPSEVKATAKVVTPCKLGARVFTGSTVKTQLLAPEPRFTAILSASTPVASAQVTV